MNLRLVLLVARFNSSSYQHCTADTPRTVPYGMDSRQRLIGVEIPLALPNIMAGVNQTIMMSLAMVVIASLVSAPGLGTLVLDGINNLRLGVGFVAGFAIVLLAILLDRVSKAALDRINAAQAEMK